MVVLSGLFATSAANNPGGQDMLPTYDKPVRAARHLRARLAALRSRDIRIPLSLVGPSLAAAEFDAVGPHPMLDEVVAKGLRDSVNGGPGLVRRLELTPKQLLHDNRSWCINLERESL